MYGNTLALSLIPVISVLGGYASENASSSQAFTGLDNQQFIYQNHATGKNTGFVGGFLGLEQRLDWSGQWAEYFLQTGLEYDYIGSISESGLNSVGFSPATYSTYDYNYRQQTQQVLGVLKGIGRYRQIYYPYVSLGLGAAFNQLSDYSVTDLLPISPLFANTTSTQFSYTLGIGFDTAVYAQMKLGLGYRYSNFGQTQYSVPFNLGAPHAYANQFLAQISYTPDFS